MSEYIVDTFGIVQDFADLHGDMSTPLYQAIMDVMVSRQREEIVRCRDCAHMHTVRSWLGMDEDECWLYADPETGALGKNRTEPDGFCAWGERRD